MHRSTLLAVVSAVVVAAAAVGVGTALGSQERTPGGAPGQTITVAGSGEASSQPDQAVVSVAVVVDGEDPTTVRAALANGTADLRTALRDAGVPDGAVTTVEFAVRQTPRDGRKEPAPSYTGVHAFEVTLNDTGRAGAVVEAAAGAGAEVRAVRFTLAPETRERLRDAALRAAVADARSQAGTLADAGDLSVVGVASMDATDGGFQPARFETAAGDTGTSIEAGDVTVSTTVRVVFNATG